MNELALFAGAGGGVLGGKLLGWRTVGYVEWEPFAQEVLKARIADGCLDAAPIFGDIRRFVSDGYADAYGRSGLVDVVSGGFPCQPFSVAGQRKADADERNMWPATIEVIRRVRPRFAFLENVPGLLSAVDAVGGHYFGTVLGDMAEAGFDAEWCVLGADDVGAPHRRKRLWLLAHRRSVERFEREPQRQCCEEAGARLHAGRVCEEWDLAHRPSDGWIQGRPEPGRFLGRPDAAECGLSVGNAECPRWQASGCRHPLDSRGEPEPGCCNVAAPASLLLGRLASGRTDAAGPSGAAGTRELSDGALAVTDLTGLGCERFRRLLDGERSALGHDAARQAEPGDAEPRHLGVPLWPPGPADRDAWERVLAARPDIAPAVESPVRGVADGLAHRLDRHRASRVARLRALGNGQVPETAATAFLTLARRLGAL